MNMIFFHKQSRRVLLVLFSWIGLSGAPLWAQNGMSAEGVIESRAGGFRFPDGTVQMTAAAAGYAPVEDTGQKLCYSSFQDPGFIITCDGTGQDGEVQAGVDWPAPRFSDNSDGTITDNLTNLIWLKEANCGSFPVGMDFEEARAAANDLSDGFCGLSDGSMAGDWRLPNINELQSLVDYSQGSPALPLGHPFTNVNLTIFWSSTTYAPSPSLGWGISLWIGRTEANAKTDSGEVLAVRGGQ